MRRVFGIVVAAVLGSALPGSTVAQSVARLPVESPILTIDSDRLFEDSQFGRNVVAELEELSAELSAENRRIEQELSREEKELTDLRPGMGAADFRELADAFDAKVQETRRAQEAKSRELNARLDDRRIVFLNAAAPILEQLMREAGAAVVLEMRSVFISSNAVDITQIAIDRLDAALDRETLPEKQP